MKLGYGGRLVKAFYQKTAYKPFNKLSVYVHSLGCSLIASNSPYGAFNTSSYRDSASCDSAKVSASLAMTSPSMVFWLVCLTNARTVLAIWSRSCLVDCCSIVDFSFLRRRSRLSAAIERITAVSLAPTGFE